MRRRSPSRRGRDAATFDGAIDLARAGHAEGFDALFRRFGSELLAFARARRAPDPDGIVNECLIRAFRRVEQFEGDEAAFRSWCFAICRNLLIDDARRRERRPVLADAAPEDHEEATADDTADLVLSDLGAQELAALLATLTPDQRDVVVLRIVADLSIAEVAEIMQKPEGAVKALQHRALRTLSKRLSSRAVSSDRGATLS